MNLYRLPGLTCLNRSCSTDWWPPCPQIHVKIVVSCWGSWRIRCWNSRSTSKERVTSCKTCSTSTRRLCLARKVYQTTFDYLFIKLFILYFSSRSHLSILIGMKDGTGFGENNSFLLLYQQSQYFWYTSIFSVYNLSINYEWG